MVCLGDTSYEVVSFTDSGKMHAVAKYPLGSDTHSAGVAPGSSAIAVCRKNGNLCLLSLDPSQRHEGVYSMSGVACLVKPGPLLHSLLVATQQPAGGYKEFSLYSSSRDAPRVSIVPGWDTGFATHDGEYVVGYSSRSFAKTKKKAAHEVHTLYVVRTDSNVTETGRDAPLITWNCPRPFASFRNVRKAWYVAVAEAVVLAYDDGAVDIIFHGRANNMHPVSHIDVDSRSGCVLCVTRDEQTYFVNRLSTGGMQLVASGTFPRRVEELALIPPTPAVVGVHCYVHDCVSYERVQVSATWVAMLDISGLVANQAHKALSASTGLMA